MASRARVCLRVWMPLPSRLNCVCCVPVVFQRCACVFLTLVFPGATVHQVGTSRVTLTAFGAHVLNWVDDGTELLYLSSTAVLDGTKAIRGGIPICWPQFGGLGQLAAHGFVRTSTWSIVQSTSSQMQGSTSASVVLSLPMPLPLPVAWPHAAAVTYTVELAVPTGSSRSTLTCRISVTNTTPSVPFTFTGALHSYFAVSDIEQVSVGPIQGLTYQDQLRKDAAGVPARVESTDTAVRFAQETDRIYEKALLRPLVIADAGTGRQLQVLKLRILHVLFSLCC